MYTVNSMVPLPDTNRSTAGTQMSMDGLGPSLDDPARFADATVQIIMIDAETWGNLKAPSVEVSGSAKAVYFVIDVMAYRPGLTLVQSGSTSVLVRKGAGFRICLAALGTTLKTTADIKTVTALAEFKQVTIFYKPLLIGLNPSDFKNRALIGFNADNFNAKFLRSLGESAAEITAFIAENWRDEDKVFPAEVYSIPLPANAYSDQRLLWSHLVALEGICNKKTIQEHLGHVSYWSNRYNNGLIEAVNPVIVADVYAAFGVKESERPNAEQSDEAYHFLRKGQTK